MERQQYDKLVKYLRDGTLPEFSDRTASWRFRKKAAAMELQNGELYMKTGQKVLRNNLGDKTLALQTIYDNAATTFNGINQGYARMKDHYTGVTQNDVREFLAMQQTHQVHKAPAKHVVNKPILSSRPHERWQIDLADFSAFKHWNSGYKYITLVVDHFSKFLWTVPTKTKSGAAIAGAFKTVLTTATALGQYPRIIQSDNGAEFTGAGFKKVIDDYNATSPEGRAKLEHITSMPYHPQSQGLVERTVRTLKEMITQYMTQNATKLWVGALSTITANYNDRVHSSTRRKPTDLVGVTNRKQLAPMATRQKKNARRMMADNPPPKHVTGSKFTLRTKVRIALPALDPSDKKHKFKKAYKTQFSDDVYSITEIMPAADLERTKYKLWDDKAGVELVRYYYGSELQRASRFRPPVPAPVVGGFFDREAHLARLHGHAPSDDADVQN